MWLSCTRCWCSSGFRDVELNAEIKRLKEELTNLQTQVTEHKQTLQNFESTTSRSAVPTDTTEVGHPSHACAAPETNHIVAVERPQRFAHKGGRTPKNGAHPQPKKYVFTLCEQVAQLQELRKHIQAQEAQVKRFKKNCMRVDDFADGIQGTRNYRHAGTTAEQSDRGRSNGFLHGAC